jgi:thiamine biosynthesis protein ThiI
MLIHLGIPFEASGHSFLDASEVFLFTRVYLPIDVLFCPVGFSGKSWRHSVHYSIVRWSFAEFADPAKFHRCQENPLLLFKTYWQRLVPITNSDAVHGVVLKSTGLPVTNMDTIIIRYAEIALKGGNRLRFENRLIANIGDCLKQSNNPFTQIERLRNRIVIHSRKECPELKSVFGIASFSSATQTEPDLEEIKKVVSGINPGASFRITCQRLDKSFPLKSMEVERELGAMVLENHKTKVSLKEYETEIGIEILPGAAYVFTDRTPGFGGLPVGISGKAIALIEDRNSLLAAWLLMKRGVEVLPVSLKDQDITLLTEYSYGYRIALKRIDDVQEVTGMAREEDAKALIVGQTLKTFKDLNIPLLTLRPLIGYGGRELEELHRNIR